MMPGKTLLVVSVRYDSCMSSSYGIAYVRNCSIVIPAMSVTTGPVFALCVRIQRAV